MKAESSLLSLVVLVPVYNDWQTAKEIVRRLDAVLTGQAVTVRLLFVDDCSSTSAPDDLVKSPLQSLHAVESLRLRRNLGHQRAIAIGLSFINAQRPCDAVLVMDGDGEDKPEDVPRLIQKFVEEKGSKVVFAKRMRRSESWSFLLCYHLYRWMHRVLTGQAVQVGNFSIIPAEQVRTLVVVSETWNHYAASVVKSRIPYEMVPAARGKRLGGRSSMDFVALVLHGLSAISVYAEVVGVRLTLVILAGIVGLTGLLVTVVVIRLGTELAIPGWATTAGGLLLMLVLQMLTVALGLTLLVLFNRNNLSFLPVRDFHFFIAEVHRLYVRGE